MGRMIAHGGGVATRDRGAGARIRHRRANMSADVLEV